VSEATSWVTVGISAIAAILGGLLAGVPAGVVQWYRRPKLELIFEGPDRKGFVIESSWWDSSIAGKKVERLFVRMRLENRGFAVASNCRVYLTDLLKIQNTTEIPTDFAMSRQLSWPGWEFDARSLPPGVVLFVDIVSVDKSESGWQFQFKGLTKSEEHLKLATEPMTYRFRVTAVADNARPFTKTIDVNYSGNWKTLKAYSTASLNSLGQSVYAGR
jgi:hypothetical protein